MRVRDFGLAIMIVLFLAACASPGRVVETWVFSRPAAVGTTAPATSPADAATPPAPAIGPVFRDVIFPLRTTSPDPARPETLAQFALDVATKGQVVEAAKFLVEAADRSEADSERNAFRMACLAGAASLYLQAGDLKAFKVVTARLRGQFDRYRLATVEPNVAALLAVAAVLDGQRVDGPNVAPILRDLRKADAPIGGR